MRACLFAVFATSLLACEAGTTPQPDPATGPAAQAQAASNAAAGTGGGDGDGGATSSADAASSTGAGTGDSTPAGYTDGDRLRAVTVNGADGSAQQVGWFDTERGEPCSFRVASDSQLRCLPIGAGFSGYYADGSCTQPIVITSAGCAAPQYALLPVGGASCVGFDPFAVSAALATEVRPIGGAHGGAVHAKASDGSCVESTRLAGFDYYATSAAIDPSSFVGGTYAGN